eukprot:1161840-Pelagomonas_calceolata.AAC.4
MPLIDFRVFHIIKEEGGADGGVVVQDCLELLNNLLRANEVCAWVLHAISRTERTGVAEQYVAPTKWVLGFWILLAARPQTPVKEKRIPEPEHRIKDDR